jgi:hypothetical protein
VYEAGWNCAWSASRAAAGTSKGSGTSVVRSTGSPASWPASTIWSTVETWDSSPAYV